MGAAAVHREGAEEHHFGPAVGRLGRRRPTVRKATATGNRDTEGSKHESYFQRQPLRMEVKYPPPRRGEDCGVCGREPREGPHHVRKSSTRPRASVSFSAGRLPMGETRVDLLHLLEDLRDAYPGSLEETIVTEIVANSLDSRASRVSVATDAAQAVLTVVDNGGGMRRRYLARYHD